LFRTVAKPEPNRGFGFQILKKVADLLGSHGLSVTGSWRDSMTTINPARPAVFRADLPVQSQTKFELVIKHQDGKSTRPYRADDAARQRQRGDRVKRPMSAIGPKKT
jgi:hypothetical protein